MSAEPKIVKEGIKVVADRWGNWIPGVSQSLEEKFGEKPLNVKDPRIPAMNVSQPDAVEWQFVAIRNGRIGIMSEFETAFEESDDTANTDPSSGFELAHEAFNTLLNRYRDNLQAVASRFPETEFMVGTGDVTFKERASLIGFTAFDFDDKGEVDGTSISSSYLDEIYPAIMEALDLS